MYYIGYMVRIIATATTVLILLVGCGKSEPTATPVSATATRIALEPTNTPRLPTATPVPPTPTDTPLPPTETATPTPTETATPLPTDTATPPPPLTGSGGGVIAFVSGWDIYLMNADGTDIRQLTTHSSRDAWPTWSPDGKQIAFMSERDGSWNLYAMDVDGGESSVRRLTSSPYLNWEPAWSPDGAWIAFGSLRHDNSDIYLMGVGTSGRSERRLTTQRQVDGYACWSPDSSQLAFVSDRDGNWEIYVMNADGTDVHRLARDDADDWDPDWSPDGTRIAFASRRDGNMEIYVVNADESDLRRLTEDPADDMSPSWSPDGSRIAFHREEGGRAGIYLVNADGSNLLKVATELRDASNPVWRPERNLSISAADLTTTVPVGTPVALDGQFSPGEWDRGLRQEFTDGGEFILMQDGRYLYLGIHENVNDLTVTSVFLEFEGKIFVLHSSGSLGTAIFKRGDDGWQLIQPFAWELYEVTSHSAGDEKKRHDFLAAKGWLANLGSMTETEEIEYQIAIPNEPFRIAVAYLWPPSFSQAAWWPVDLSDDCLNIELLQGNIAEDLHTPLLLQFAPETWVAFYVP